MSIPGERHFERHYGASPWISAAILLGRTGHGLHLVVEADMDRFRREGIANIAEFLRFDLDTRRLALDSAARYTSLEVWTTRLPRDSAGEVARDELRRRLAESGRTRPPAVPAPAGADAAVATVVATLADLDVAGDVSPDANLEIDLGLDSLDRVRLLQALEDRTGHPLPIAARLTATTARELADAIRPFGSATRARAVTDDPWPALLVSEGATAWPLPEPGPVHTVAARGMLRATQGLSRLTLGLRVSGTEHIPRQGPVILCPNHQCYVDGGLVVCALPGAVVRRLAFLGASEYFVHPLAARFARAAQIVAIDPDRDLVSALQAGAGALRRQRVLVIFPEGERTGDGELARFKRGALILARRLGVPIVPVALDGLMRVWPRGRALAWRELLPGGRAAVQIAYGPPVDARALSGRAGDAGDREAAGALRAIVQAMLERLRSGG